MILSELRNYFFVGGMPECFQVQSEILESYRHDFSKYKPRIDPACLDAVFLNTAKSVGEQLKYTRLNSGHSGQMNRKAFDLLNKAQIVQKISSCDPSSLPLGATANQKKFRALRAIEFAVVDGLASREEIMSFLEPLLFDDDFNDGTDFLYFVARTICHLYPEGFMEKIKKAFDDEIIGPWMIGYRMQFYLN